MTEITHNRAAEDASRAPAKKSKGGRPRYFDPTPEQAAVIKELWESPTTRKHVRERASKIMGKTIEHHHLRDWYARISK
jgi:hypothetical protein